MGQGAGAGSAGALREDFQTSLGRPVPSIVPSTVTSPFSTATPTSATTATSRRRRHEKRLSSTSQRKFSSTSKMSSAPVIQLLRLRSSSGCACTTTKIRKSTVQIVPGIQKRWLGGGVSVVFMGLVWRVVAMTKGIFSTTDGPRWTRIGKGNCQWRSF